MRFIPILLFAVLFPSLPAAAAPNGLDVRSHAAVVLDQESGQVLFGKNTQSVLPIASITKLMTAIVTLDANLDPEEPVAISDADIDWLKGSHSRLSVGATLVRDEMLILALMASENRAASALAQSYPGGTGSVRAQNEPEGAAPRHDRHAFRRRHGSLQH